MRTRNSDLLSVAPISMTFLAANLILFVYCAMASNDFMRINPDVLTGLGMSIRERVWEGEWARLILPAFLHAGFMHIALNTWGLYSYGPAAEVHFGKSNFATLYLLSGAGGIAFSQIFGGGHSIGASTSLFGIIGAEFSITVLNVPVLRNAWRASVVRDELLRVGVYFAIGLSGMMGPVDNWGHLGGFVLGLTLGAFFELWRRHKRFAMPLVVAVVLGVALMIGAARWTIFSPYYHLHMAALAGEARDTAREQREFEAARKWAGVWRDERIVNYLIRAYKAGAWTAEDARENSYKWFREVARQKLMRQPAADENNVY